MKELNIKQEKTILQLEIENWFKVVKKHINKSPSGLTEQVRLLTAIRNDIYEDLNQLQHKALIIESAEILQKEYPKINKWKWHPKQTSHPDEADLTGYTDAKVIISAEITSSMKPVGTIDTRIRKTLNSLNGKKGKRIYFVQTAEMFNRAKTKITKNNWDITPRQL